MLQQQPPQMSDYAWESKPNINWSDQPIVNMIFVPMISLLCIPKLILLAFWKLALKMNCAWACKSNQKWLDLSCDKEDHDDDTQFCCFPCCFFDTQSLPCRNQCTRRQSFFLLLLLDIIVPYSHNTNQPCSSFLTILTNGGGSGWSDMGHKQYYLLLRIVQYNCHLEGAAFSKELLKLF